MSVTRLLWLRVLPVSMAGVLGGHDLAYRLVGKGLGGLHVYLAHGPELLAALLLPAALLSGRARAGAVRPRSFALLGLAGFALMEHGERLVHGELPWLLTSPAFLLGLALQLPFALLAWWLARTLLAPRAGTRRLPPLPARLPLVFRPALPPVLRPAPLRLARPRGPPVLL